MLNDLTFIALKAVAAAKAGRFQDTVLRVVCEESKVDWPIASRAIGECVYQGHLHRHNMGTRQMLCLTDKGRAELERAEKEAAP